MWEVEIEKFDGRDEKEDLKRTSTFLLGDYSTYVNSTKAE